MEGAQRDVAGMVHFLKMARNPIAAPITPVMAVISFM